MKESKHIAAEGVVGGGPCGGMAKGRKRRKKPPQAAKRRGSDSDDESMNQTQSEIIYINHDSIQNSKESLIDLLQSCPNSMMKGQSFDNLSQKDS